MLYKENKKLGQWWNVWFVHRKKKGLIPIQVQSHKVSDKSDFNPEKSEMGVVWPIRGRAPFSLKDDLIRGVLFRF